MKGREKKQENESLGERGGGGLRYRMRKKEREVFIMRKLIRNEEYNVVVLCVFWKKLLCTFMVLLYF